MNESVKTFIVAIVGSLVLSLVIPNAVLMILLCFLWGWFSRDIVRYFEL